jgi:chromosome segregation ATPase
VKAIESCKKCGINELTEDISNKLEALKSEKETYLKEQLDPKIKKGDAIEEELRALRTQHTDQSKICDDKRNELDEAEKKVNECNTKIQGLKNSIQENKRDIETADNSIRPLIADTQWQYDWTKEPDLFKADLE